MTKDDDLTDYPGPVEFPVDGVLDLHTFSPRELKELLPAYFSECMGKGIFEVRVIHGKGSGSLRRTVHSILKRLPEGSSFRLADGHAGGWGATIVLLKPLEKLDPFGVPL